MTADEYIQSHWIPKQIWNNLNREKHQNRFKQIATYLTGETAIDVGCACGHSMKHLEGFYQAKWSGADFSLIAVNEAKKLFPSYDFYWSSVKGVWPSIKFDSVVCSEVMEHCEDDQGLVEGLLGITGKVLVLTTPNRYVNDPGHLRIYDEKMIASLFKGQNFQIHSIGNFYYIVVEV